MDRDILRVSIQLVADFYKVFPMQVRNNYKKVDEEKSVLHACCYYISSKYMSCKYTVAILLSSLSQGFGLQFQRSNIHCVATNGRTYSAKAKMLH